MTRPACAGPVKFSCRLSGGLGQRRRNRQVSRRHAFGALRWRNRKAFRTHDFDIGDAEETEHVAQVRLLEVTSALLVEAAPGAGDDDLLSAGKSFSAACRVLEGLSSHCQAVDPG